MAHREAIIRKTQACDERVNELLNLMDFPPATYRGQYPNALSGGQQQRVGVDYWAKSVHEWSVGFAIREISCIGSVQPTTRNHERHTILL